MEGACACERIAGRGVFSTELVAAPPLAHSLLLSLSLARAPDPVGTLGEGVDRSFLVPFVGAYPRGCFADSLYCTRARPSEPPSRPPASLAPRALQRPTLSSEEEEEVEWAASLPPSLSRLASRLLPSSYASSFQWRPGAAAAVAAQGKKSFVARTREGPTGLGHAMPGPIYRKIRRYAYRRFHAETYILVFSKSVSL